MKVQVAMRGKVALCRGYLSVWAILLLLFSVLPAAAALDVTTFGPERYDRLKGAPTVYTETFRGCSAADRVLLQVWNGDSKVTRITAAEILVNGRAILAENDFKKADAYLERRIDTKGVNDLKITLKSGDYKEPSFLRIAVVSNGCDTTPPTIFDLSPVDTALLATARPLIAAAYSDGVEADASGIDPASVQLTLDGVSITTAATLDATGIRYLPLADLAEGLHSVTLDVADRVGNRASRSWSFFIDTTPPVITVTSPADQALSPVLNVQISGTLSEAATLFVAGKPVALNGSAFDHPILLTPGPNTILLTADDAAGNRGSTTLTLWADNTPPVVTLTSPPDGLITNVAQQTVSGTLSEVATLELNGGALSGSGLNFSTLTTLTEGENRLNVTAVDLAGNIGSASVVVTLDTIAPQISVTSPSAGSIRNNPEVNISGSVSEVVTLITVNGIPAQLAGMTFTLAALTLPDGDNSLEIVAVDRAGNRGTATLLLHVDTVAPIITVVTPADHAIVNTPQIIVSGSVNEADATLTINGSTVALLNGAFSLANFALHEGENLLAISAVDLAGNRTSITVPLTLDTIAPQINISAPLEQSFVNTPQIGVSGTLSEEVATLTINGRSVIVSGTSFTSADLDLLEGANEIRIVAVDRAGNSSVATRIITLDTVAPQLTITTPLAGTLLASATVELQAHADELLARAELNETPAAVTGMTIAVPSCPLSEGENLLRLVAFDRAGNRGEAQVTVVRDSTPPPAPLFTLPLALTRIPQLTLSGQAEGGATVTLLAADSGAILAVVTADAAGAFVFPELTLAEGENRFSAFAVDAAANRSEESDLLVVTLDTIAPQLAITSPLTGTIGNQRIVTVTGTTDDSSATLTLSGQPVTLNGATFSHPVELQLGSNTLTLSAVDRAGNHSSVIVQVEFDDVPPVITVTTPPDGLLTNVAQVTISGQVSESHCTVELGGTALTVSGESFSGVVALVEGENSLTLTASDRAGNRGSASLTVRSDRTPPTLAIIAPAAAIAGETLRLQIKANDASGLTLVETSAAGRPFAALATPAALLEQSLVYTLSPDLAPATTVLLALRGLDGAGNSAVVTTTVTISAGPSGPGYLQGEVYDDHSGLRLAGVTVKVTSAGTSSEVVSAEDGGYLFELPAGDYEIELSRSGYTSSYRTLTLRPEQTITVLDARLTALAPAVVAGYNGRLLTAPLEAGPAWSGPSVPALTVALPEGALSESLDARLTPLSSQGLPAPLPRGWSPLAALDLRFAAAGLPLPEPLLFFYPATLRLPLGDSGLSAGDELTVARYDLAVGAWLAQTTAIVSSDATAAVASLSRGGIYALLLADPAPLTPPQPLNGEALAATTATADDLNGWLVSGEVAPAAAPPALGLRAVGEVRIAPGAELSAESRLASGLLLRGRVTESFDLFSGEAVQPSDYVQDLLLFRAPCLSGAGAGRIAPSMEAGLRASFPVTPSHQYTIAELLLGEVGIAIVPPEVEQSGVLAGPDGALLMSSDGIALLLPAGALERTVPVQLQSLANTAVAPLIPEGFALLAAVRIDLSRQSLQTGALLSLPLPSNFDPLRPVVLAQVFTAGGGERLRGVAFLKPVGSLLTSVTEVGGVTLPGIRAGGTYCLLQSESLLGLVRGTVRNATSQPFSGALITANTGSLADLSAASGSYLLFAPLGQVHVTALDLSRFDRGEASGTLAYAESALSLDPVIRATVPSVVALTPDNGASGVDPATRISITFSEPVERSSISSASIVLSSSDNTPVAGVFSFSSDATIVSFYPEARLVSEGRYTIAIASSVRDMQGYTLASPLTTTFVVRDTTPPPMPSAGSISATFPDEEGMITVTATQGSAEYDATVLIINDTSGEIVSIAPFSNGSFNARIHGQLGDEIQVVLMDNAGNQTLISYLTFTAADGRTLVTAKGGKVAGEGGLLLELPAGALVGPAVVKITPVAQAALPHPVPAEARFIGAVSIDSGGLSFAKEVELSIPLPADLPAGAFPFLARPIVHVNADGTEEQVYEIIDTVKIVNGRLTTASPPFDGVVVSGLYIFVVFVDLVPAIVSGTTYQDMNNDGVYTANVDRPVSRAVIRSPGMWNFLSYSGKNGFYAALTDLTDLAGRRDYSISAIHPLTQLKKTAVGTLSTAQNLVQNLNFLLADANTIFPDKTPPLIELKLAVAPGQGPEARFVAGTVPIGTDLAVTVGVVDQLMGAVTLGIDFSTPGMISPNSYSVQLDQEGEGSAGLADRTLRRYLYQPIFNAPIGGRQPYYFRPDAVGTYRFTVEGIDSVGNRNSRTLQVRAVLSGTDFGASVEGAPEVDEILPANGATAVMVNTQVTVAFSEPVDAETVTSATCYLLDQVTGQAVPAFVAISLENGRVVATLTPKGNLFYGREYEVVVTRGILDAKANETFDNVKLPLAREVRSRFTTKRPAAYDLAVEDQFAGGFDLALYTHDESGRTFAYVTAREHGWRVIDVTEPQAPRLVETHKQTNTGVSWSERGVAVEQEVGILALTEDIRYVDGEQYGYVRFLDLKTTPEKPLRAGQEKLAEAFSGIPGRVALLGQYAFVATVGAGLQVVDIAAAQAHFGASDGSTIVGTFDCEGEGYGAANDILLYRWNRALLTTNGGYLLILDVSTPQLPQLLSAYKPGGFSAGRVAAVADFGYADADGYPLSLDLGVTVGRDGRLRTLDLSDPYAPQVLGVAIDESGVEVITVAMDLALNKSAGLAFVTTFSSIQIFDLRNPHRPRLLSTLTQLPGPDGEMQPLGAVPAIVEKDGWVYLTDQSRGLRVLDVDAVAVQVTPTHLVLDGDGRPQTGQISYTISPTQYQANKAEVVIYKDNEVFKAFPAKTQGGGTVDLAAELFPLPGSYYAQVVLNRNFPAELRSAKVPFIPQAVLIPDYNHDKEIDATDYSRAAKGDPYYFWINDDDDSGETGGDDIPLPLPNGAPGFPDADNNVVDGVRDLIDFFPVALDVKALVGVFPPNVYQYRLKSAAENLRVVFPELSTMTVKNYLVDVDTARRLGEVPTFPLSTSGEFSMMDGEFFGERPQAKLDRLISTAANQDAPPVILLEGIKPGTTPLVLEIVDAKGNQVFATSLKLSLDGVEQMFLHKNLIKVLSEHSEYHLVGHDPVPANKGMPDRLVKADFTNPAHFEGFDAESDQNNFVHVHGYNINGEDARGEQTETFKRLYWSGNRARFWGITWYSWDSQWPSLERTPNYHVNVRHAFNTGRLLKEFVNQNVAGNVTIFAHSLGNMVVSSAIGEGMTVARYLMVNAAVAEEAYTPQEAYKEVYDGGTAYDSGAPWRNATREQMYHPAWRYPGGVVVPFENAYQPQLWASEWYKLFAPDDGRSTLTWRNRFAKVRDLPGTFVYYAPTDEAFRPFLYTVEMAANNAGYQPNATDWPGVEEVIQNAFNPNNPLGAYAFALQELLKGRMVLGDEDNDSGGWGFNLTDDDYWQVKNTNIVPIDSVTANAIRKDQLKTRPFFLKNPDFDFLYNDHASVSAPLREELLANELPALTFAAGHRGVEEIRVDHPDRDLDIRQTFAVKKPWPQDRLEGYEWRHSDIYVVAYPYLSGLYDEWAKKIKGE